MYPAMDVLVFPSRREGFPNVPLEAAAAGVPTVGYRVTGVEDAIVDGVTGTLVDVGNLDAMTSAVLRYLEDVAVRRQHGLAARARAIQSFSRERIWSALADEYEHLVARELGISVGVASTAGSC
jgi:glycosyltransferase involved in cell wall biosynthesis